MYRTIDYFKLGYINIGGFIKASIKGIIPGLILVTLWILTFMGALGLGFAIEIPMLIVSVIAALLNVWLTPVLTNTNIILTRAYVLEGDRIGLREAFREANARMSGRRLAYYLKSFALGILMTLVMLLLVITLIGFVALPFVAMIFNVVSIALVYQEEVGVRETFRYYFKDMFWLGIGLCLISLISALIPFIGGILVLPAMIAPQLFVTANLD